MRVQSQFIEMFGNHSTTPVSHYIADSYPGEWGVEDKDGSGVKVIRTTNFTNAGKLDLTDVVTRSIIEKKIRRKTIKKFDTILERSGGTAENPVGRVVLFEEDDQYLCNNFTQVLRFKDIDPRYAFYSLFYYYQMNKTAVRSMGSKTTGIQNLDMNRYLEIGIPNASDDEQSLFIAIAEQADKSKFVGFKSQFIEMFGNSIHTKKLIEVCNIEKGSTITKEQTSNGDIPVVAGGLEPSCYHNVANRPAGMITVSASGANAGYVNYWEVPIFASDCNTIYPIELEKVSPIFMYWQLKVIQKQIYKLQKGGAQPHVYGKDLADMQIVQPPMEFQLRYIKIAEQADKSKYYN